MTLRGMTWAHARATEPFAAFARSRPELPAVHWNSQPLAAFEAYPISTLAQQYDLLVIDHPGIGAAVAAGALWPLEELFDGAQLATWERGTVGPTWSCYRYDGRQWALPIDAATQVSVLSASLAGPAPSRWTEVPSFAAAHRTALCLAGPHAGLGLLAMASAAGAITSAGEAIDALVDPIFAVEALELLKSLWPLVDQEASSLDPIGVHEAIAAGGGPVYCPLTYGYGNYAPTVRWSDAPGWKTDRPGSVLGGTGLAVSARTGADRDELRAYLTAYLDPAVQNRLVPSAGGQPATCAAWLSSAVDQAAGGFFSSTLRSIQAAWIRPQRPGWIAVQDRISEIVRETVVHQSDSAAAVRSMNSVYAAQEARV